MNSLTINGQPILKDVKLVMFDKDGTIIDIHHYWGSMIKMRATVIINSWFNQSNQKEAIKNELIEGMGIDLKTNKMKPEGPVGIKPRTYIAHVATEIICKNGVAKTEEDVERIFKTVDQQTEKDLTPLLKMLPYVKILLEQLHQKKIQLAIVTTDITERAIVTLKALKIDKYFQYILGADQVENTKPAADLANKIVVSSGISPSQMAVIGDHVVDIQMGINGKIACNIGVLTGLGCRKQFNSLPCHVIETFKELRVE